MIAIVYCSSNGILALCIFDSCLSEHFLKFFMAGGELNTPVLRTGGVNVVLVGMAFFVLKKDHRLRLIVGVRLASR